MRRPARFYSLQRPKLRLSWNKHNLYNIARMVGRDRSTQDRMTFFQMKWDAKSRTRAYHGEHIAEKKWKRMFSHRLMSAVDLPPKYLAENDGSEQAAGRGSGVTTNEVNAEKYSRLLQPSKMWRITHSAQRPSKKRGDPEAMLAKHHQHMTPYMHMAYAPLERRLDMAVFRALFASSVRQARQFIIHGAVEVNGKKMIHPAYQLNPGDMFQVEVEKVLYGTGKPAADKKNRPDISKPPKARKRSKENKADSEVTDLTDEMKRLWKPKNGVPHPKYETYSKLVDAPNDILDGFEQLKTRIGKREGKMGVRELRSLRQLISKARKALGDLPEDTKFEDMMQDFKLLLATRDQFFDELVEEAEARGASSETPAQAAQPAAAAEAGSPSQERRIKKVAADLTPEQAKRFRAALDGDRFQLSNEKLRELADIVRDFEDNPIDPSKPYHTPWEPRKYMSAFAFIPRYLEVNPNICAAVYLRHPVARKGMAEVPTPFSYLTSQLAHNWYLQRGPRLRT